MRSSAHRFVCQVFLGILSVNFSLAAADLSSEERLQAIRVALVEAAMKSNTRVSATSWMDSNGQLRELNRFTSDIKLREFQVAKYDRNADPEPRAELALKRIDTIHQNHCEAPQAKAALRQVMTVGLKVSTDLPASHRYHAQQLGFAARTLLLQSADRSERWRLITGQAQARAYDRLSYGQGEENIQWHAQLTVAPAPDGGVSDDYSAFGLILQVSGPGQRQAWFNAQEIIVPSISGRVYGQPKIDVDTHAALGRAVSALAAQLEMQLACEPQSFAVEQAGNRLSLQAGSHAGVRVGDKLMLADASVLPRHTLEPGALDAAMLVEVKSVTPYQAEIKQVAGRKQKIKGAWVAWPYTY